MTLPRAAALHYAGKIDVWEIWNEPDVEGTFKCDCDRAALYAQMLAGSYTAIKDANPHATVLIGGLSIHDYHNGGMAFLDAVVAASGGKLNFDVLSIHPYMPDRMPESTDPKTVVQNFPYRLDMSYKWLQAHGAGDKEIWITEDGYSTCTGCGTLGVSEDEQARRLIRLNVIAMGAPGVTHFDYFQAKDKFNAGPSDLWGNMGIMRNDLSEKPAYVAYRVMTGQLTGATFIGLGPIARGVQNRWQAQFDRYHYKFSTANGIVQVLWKIGVPESVDVPVEQSNVTLVKSDGTSVPLTVNGGKVSVTISEDPIFLDEIKPKSNVSLDSALDPTSPTGFKPAPRFAQYWQQNGGLPLFGYAISGERTGTQPDRRQRLHRTVVRARPLRIPSGVRGHERRNPARPPGQPVGDSERISQDRPTPGRGERLRKRDGPLRLGPLPRTLARAWRAYRGPAPLGPARRKERGRQELHRAVVRACPLRIPPRKPAALRRAIDVAGPETVQAVKRGR